MDPIDRDLAYLRKLGEYQREGAEQRLAEHLALPLSERLRRSLALSLLYAEQMRGRPRDDHPEKFYERAKALGMYRP